jgi:hypothetical protein
MARSLQRKNRFQQPFIHIMVFSRSLRGIAAAAPAEALCGHLRWISAGKNEMVRRLIYKC